MNAKIQIMHNPTDNNHACGSCNVDYYNLNPDNVKHCKSCAPNKNQFIMFFSCFHYNLFHLFSLKSLVLCGLYNI